MNKREISEIKKQFKPEYCSLSKICACYVDGDKNIRTELDQAFLSLPEEETLKYFEIFKKTLTGKIGKCLLNLEFPRDAEMENGAQDFLLELRDSRLKDKELLEKFYQKVIESYRCEDHYYIILVYGDYDIPGAASDDTEMFDSSEDVYSFLLCTICPVLLSKPGLSYNTSQNQIGERIRDWVVDAPKNGFLFPAFIDRNADIHSTLYFTKKESDIQPDFISEILGCEIPQTQTTQKDCFNELILTVLGDDAGYDEVKSIHERLEEMAVENENIPDPVPRGCNEIRRVFEESGIPEEKMEDFKMKHEIVFGSEPVLLTNIAGEKGIVLETQDVTVKVNPERMDLIRTRVIDGRECIVIAAGSRISINGLEVRTVS